MPTYEYHCAKCGEFEVTQRITDAPLKRCPTCKSKVKKLISNTSFQLKGSGWYQTDYGSKKAADKGAAKSEAKGDTKSDGTGESKGDSKSESKGDTPAAGGEASGKSKSSGKKGDTTAKAA